MDVIGSRTCSLARSSLLFAAALSLLTALGGCRKKTPAEKFGDKMDEIGEDIDDGVEEATDN